MIIDSNLIIYGPKPGQEKLRQYLRGVSVAVSAISLVEVLGYHKLTESDRRALIAATALASDGKLLTHNVKDFAWIPGLTVVDPLAAGDPP